MILARFQSLSRREKRLILTAAGVLAIALAHSLIWRPYATGHRAALERIQRLDLLSARISRLPPAAQQQADQRSLAAILAETATQSGLSIQSLQTIDGGGAVSVMELAPFDALLLWLEMLERDQGLELASISLTGGAVAGFVAATVTFAKGPP